MPDTPEVAVDQPAQTPEAQHRELTEGVGNNLEDVLGMKPEVTPTTDETPLKGGDSLEEFYERGIRAKGGVEPSKSFRSKFLERFQKMHPGQVINAVKKGSEGIKNND